MGHRKKDKKKRSSFTLRGIDPAAIRETLAAKLTQAAAATAAPSCLTKLTSLSPELREEGCLDVAHFALTPCHQQLLVAHGAHHLLCKLLLDPNIDVRAAASCGLRNLFVIGPDLIVDTAVTVDNLPAVLLQSLSDITAQHSILISQHGTAEVQPTEEEDDDEENDEQDGAGKHSSVPRSQQHQDRKHKNNSIAALHSVQHCIEELILLLAVIVESNDAAAQLVASQSDFMTALVDALLIPVNASAFLVKVAIASSDLLRLLSEDNDIAVVFFTQQLSQERQAALNAITSIPPNVSLGDPSLAESSGCGVPLSPTLLLVSLNMCGVLMHVSPNATNAVRLAPFIAAALQTLPMREWAKVLPALSEGYPHAEELRLAAVKQSQDRLRSLISGIDLFSELLNWVCSFHSDEEDDEVSFSRNPHRHIISDVLLPLAIALLQNVLAPVDIVLRTALYDTSENSDVTTLQQLLFSVDVGLFSLASSLLLLLPVNMIGSPDFVYRAAVSALQSRFALVTSKSAAEDQSQSSAVSQLFLQTESLTEICWTIQRKDSAGLVHPQPQDLDIFNRLAWERGTTRQTKLFLIGNVACIGQKFQGDGNVVFACGKFVTNMLQSDSTEEAEDELAQLEVRAEAANGVMDMFSGEEYDASVYVPLGVHGDLVKLLPVLKQRVGMVRRAQRRTDATIIHLQEIATNLEAFIQYKRRHCSGL